MGFAPHNHVVKTLRAWPDSIIPANPLRIRFSEGTGFATLEIRLQIATTADIECGAME